MKEMQYIPVDLLNPHPDNPRKELGDLTELAASIKQSGIYQNLTVVPAEDGDGYTVVIGHRRRAAAKLAGLTELPCIVADMSYKEQISTMLLENMQRSDLTVYEQAQGFQMMLNMGDSIADIASGTGLSESTIRRRVKLLELDSAKFKAAEARGGTLFDFAEVSKIKSIDLRNEVLDAVGTANFNNKLKSALDKEKTEERIAEIKAVLDVFAFRIERVGEFGGVAVSMSYVNGWYGNSAKEIEIPKDSENVRYFYTESGYSLALYKEREKTEENSAEERERQKAKRIHDEHESFLQDLTGRHYALRRDFVMDYSGNAKTDQLIAAFAADMLIVGGYSHYYNTRARILNLMGIEADEESEFTAGYIEERIEQKPYKALLAALSGYCDGAGEGYWRNEWRPEKGVYVILYKDNEKLNRFYNLLCALGYEMSDDEREMQDGSSNYLQPDFVQELE